MKFSIPHDRGLEPIRECINALRSYSMETSRILVGSLSKLAPSMKISQHELHRWDLELGMDIHRNSPPVIRD